MKFPLPLLGAILLGGCTTPSGLILPSDSHRYAVSTLSAVGARNAAGLPTGEYRIVDAARGSTAAQGRFLNGKMDGRWVFSDSHQVKIAEITFQKGVASGPYKTYFGSIFNPVAAGKLESAGRFEDGQVVGRHLAYSSTGSAFSVATFEAGRLRQVEFGPVNAATKTAAADATFLDVLENTVRSAVR